MLRAAALFALALVSGPVAVKVDDLVSRRDELNEKVVQVTADIRDYEAKLSKKGNKYTVFKLIGKKHNISVWMGGHLKEADAPKNGDTVQVIGIFDKEKKVGTLTFLNELDASPRKEKPYGVKIIKRKKT